VDFVGPTEGNSKTALFLDVREPDEVDSMPWPVAEGAEIEHIPLNSLRKSISDLGTNKERQILVICRRGPRSYQAALILKQAGFKNVYVIGGGTQAALS